MSQGPGSVKTGMCMKFSRRKVLQRFEEVLRRARKPVVSQCLDSTPKAMAGHRSFQMRERTYKDAILQG